MSRPLAWWRRFDRWTWNRRIDDEQAHMTPAEIEELQRWAHGGAFNESGDSTVHESTVQAG